MPRKYNLNYSVINIHNLKKKEHKKLWVCNGNNKCGNVSSQSVKMVRSLGL